jgi:hypothetical protein
MKKFILLPLFFVPLFSAAAPDPAAIEAASRDAKRALLERGCRLVDEQRLECPEGRVELAGGRFVFVANSTIPPESVWLELLASCLQAQGETTRHGSVFECRVSDAVVRVALSENGRELVVEIR